MSDEQYIQKIADIILKELDNFSQYFRPHAPVKSTDQFAYNPNPITSSISPQSRLSKSMEEVRLHELHLQDEPFIAYVKVEVDQEARLYLICRGYPPSTFEPITERCNYASYKTSIGQIAEYDIGSEFEILVGGRERTIKVLERNLFTPKKKNQQWDGINNRINISKELYSIESLIEFLEPLKKIEKEIEISEAEKIKILEEEKQREYGTILELSKKIKREVRNKIELRDQPILDQNQGAVFRLPLSTQIILSGAAGTGKTTTLIKRIAQKSDPEFLTEEERDGLNELDGTYINNENWVLFTPTDLLRIYLKEAFAKESMPASDKRIKTWEDKRLPLGRDNLKFLKVGEKGYFNVSKNNYLRFKNNSDLISYTRKFTKFYNEFIMGEFIKANTTLTKINSSIELIKGFDEIHEKYGKDISKIGEDEVVSLAEELHNLRGAFNEVKNIVDEQLEDYTNRIINTDSSILKETFDIIQRYKPDAGEEDEEFEEEEDDTEEVFTTESTIIAKRQIKKTISWYAQKKAQKQRIANHKLHAPIINILSPYLSDSHSIAELGKKIIDRRVSNTLTKGYTNLLNRIPQYYQRFRIQELKSSQCALNKDYEKDIRNKKISNHEIDILIFTILRNARKIFDRHKYMLNENVTIVILEEIKSIYKTQVAVDEATDFSTIQLGCMFYLSHPNFTSVIFSGDLMQRVTRHGVTSWDECNFISDKFRIEMVSKVYRQSPKLLRIAQILYEQIQGEVPSFKSAFPLSDTDPHPLKYHSKHNDYDLGKWLAERIVEIFEINGNKLPSISIFVAEDEHIDRVKDIIEPHLEEHSIGVKGCPKGEILGSEGKIRIFSVEYIKGLEFEGVFFVDFDDMSEQEPELFDKILYVGLTRASSYLAVTYNTKFPGKVNFIEEYFEESNWSIPSI